MFRIPRSLASLPLWLPAYLQRRRPPRRGAPTDILFCVCDHFEPFHGVGRSDALRRVRTWVERCPTQTAPFRDHDGRPPRHTFFYPIEQYDSEIVENLLPLTRQGLAEIEIHLHHEGDTPETLRDKLEEGKRRLTGHGLLCRDKTGAVRYGFVHGNWALDNSHPEGRHCGVNTELTVLQATGCYADFTMPSAPHPTQTRTINSLYYAVDTPAPKSHDTGTPVRVTAGPSPSDGSASCASCIPHPASCISHPASNILQPSAFSLQPIGCPSDQGLLLIQGPLGLNWRRRKWGVLPRIENGELAGNNPPRADRLRIWLRLGIQVLGRPDWLFIKVHTHGCDEARGNLQMLLGEPMAAFHRLLTTEFNDGRRYRLHYVTARELVNIAHAAEAGQSGNPSAFRDFRYRGF